MIRSTRFARRTDPRAIKIIFVTDHLALLISKIKFSRLIKDITSVGYLFGCFLFKLSLGQVPFYISRAVEHDYFVDLTSDSSPNGNVTFRDIHPLKAWKRVTVKPFAYKYVYLRALAHWEVLSVPGREIVEIISDLCKY